MKPLTRPPPLLLDMRWVYDHPRKAGEGESLTNCRDMLLKSPKGFMDQMARLELAWQATEKAERERQTAELSFQTSQRSTSPSEEGPDVGSGTAKELIQRLIDRARSTTN